MNCFVSKFISGLVLSTALLGQAAEGTIHIERPIRGRHGLTIEFRAAMPATAQAIALHAPRKVPLMSDLFNEAEDDITWPLAIGAAATQRVVASAIIPTPMLPPAAVPSQIVQTQSFVEAQAAFHPIYLRFGDSPPSDFPLTSEAFEKIWARSRIMTNFLGCVSSASRLRFDNIPSKSQKSVIDVWGHVKANIHGIARLGFSHLYRHGWDRYHFLNPGVPIAVGMFSSSAGEHSAFYFVGGRTGFDADGRGCQESYLALLDSFAEMPQVVAKIDTTDGLSISFECSIKTRTPFPVGRAKWLGGGADRTTVDGCDTVHLIIKQAVRREEYVGRARDVHFSYIAIASKSSRFASLY